MPANYALQLHLHGPGSEGSASIAAHDHMAAKTGSVDAIWWTEHDWKLANYFKIRKVDFDTPVETDEVPSAVPEAGQPPVSMTKRWVPEPGPETGPGCAAEIDGTRGFDGESSLKIAAFPSAGGAPATMRAFLKAQRHREKFSLFSRPEVRIAVYPEAGALQNGGIFIEFVLSEQPPDLRQPRIRYAAGSLADGPELENGVLLVPVAMEAGQWNVLKLDPAADAGRLGLPAGGLDNSLQVMRLGATAGTGPVVAWFDGLEFQPRLSGGELLAAERELIGRLPLKVKHFVGMEVTWYGRHINAFGPRVPIPDYPSADPAEFTTAGVVRHIHRHGGLACFNHPPVGNPAEVAALTLESQAWGADLIEIAHKKPRLVPRKGSGEDAHDADELLRIRLRLWDQLSMNGIFLTGLGVSDSHHARRGWEPDEINECAWVSHVWAPALEEEALLKGLGQGRVYFADPSRFRGSLDIQGPGELVMGSIAPQPVRGELLGVVSGARPGDRLVWICNGVEAGATTLASDHETACFPIPDDTEHILAIRFELRREFTEKHHERAVACTNPVFLVPSEHPIRRQDHRRLCSNQPIIGPDQRGTTSNAGWGVEHP